MGGECCGPGLGKASFCDPSSSSSVSGGLGLPWCPRCSWCRWIPWSDRPSRRDGPARACRGAGKRTGNSMWGVGDLKTSDLVAGEEGTQALSRVVSSLKRKRRGFPNHPPSPLFHFPIGSGRPSGERRCPRSLGATWTTRVSGE